MQKKKKYIFIRAITGKLKVMATTDTAIDCKVELYCKSPKSLDLNGNISEKWRKFKQSFDIFLKASSSIRKPDEIKVVILLNIIGEDGIELYNNIIRSIYKRQRGMIWQRCCNALKSIVFPRRTPCMRHSSSLAECKWKVKNLTAFWQK